MRSKNVKAILGWSSVLALLAGISLPGCFEKKKEEPKTEDPGAGGSGGGQPDGGIGDGGDGGTGGTDACSPEDDESFCSELGSECGSVSGEDNCGETRTVASCGSCSGELGCNFNKCTDAECTPESDEAFCARLAKSCGELTADDNCGVSRTANSCGGCGGELHCVANACVGVSRIVASDSHTCALLADKTVLCWGSNTYGQLGDGTSTPEFSSLPQKVPGVKDVVEIDLGGPLSCVRHEGGTVTCWGSTPGGSSPARIDGFEDVVELAVTDWEACARHSDGTVSCRKMGVEPAPDPEVVPNLANVIQLEAGGEHYCALHENRTVSCWGKNRYGELGDGTQVDRDTPSVVPNLVNVKEIAIGWISCALLESGEPVCWGANWYGAIGDGSVIDNNNPPHRLTPTKVVGLDDVEVKALSVGKNHSCALLGDGTLRCWGANLYGELGVGTTDPTSVPIAVSALSDVAELSAGGHHTCARLESGDISCWGFNDGGQVGDGTTIDRLTPTPVVGLSR